MNSREEFEQIRRSQYIFICYMLAQLPSFQGDEADSFLKRVCKTCADVNSARLPPIW